jgi:hypothetical protein
VFVRKIQPWSGGGVGSAAAPPENMTVSSNTLNVGPVVGGNQEIELINSFSQSNVPSPFIPAPFSNVLYTANADFTLGPLDITADDGAVINLRLETNEDLDSAVMTLDPSIMVPSAFADQFPFTIENAALAYMTLQLDLTSLNAWYVASFVVLPNAFPPS